MEFDHRVCQLRCNCQLYPTILFLTSELDIPLSNVDKDGSLENICRSVSAARASDGEPVPVICVCRRGNDSQLAVKKLKTKLQEPDIKVMDIAGGLNAWARQVDPDFPTY